MKCQLCKMQARSTNRTNCRCRFSSQFLIPTFKDIVFKSLSLISMPRSNARMEFVEAFRGYIKSRYLSCRYNTSKVNWGLTDEEVSSRATVDSWHKRLQAHYSTTEDIFSIWSSRHRLLGRILYLWLIYDLSYV